VGGALRALMSTQGGIRPTHARVQPFWIAATDALYASIVDDNGRKCLQGDINAFRAVILF
jgi:hypothetical protein